MIAYLPVNHDLHRGLDGRILHRHACNDAALNPRPLSVDEPFVAFFARIVSCSLLLIVLMAGLTVSLCVIAMLRPLGTWGVAEVIGLLAALAVVFHAGLFAYVVLFLLKPADYEWLKLGRPAWLSMIALCYVAGVGIGVISTA
jgi:hypothetical protein